MKRFVPLLILIIVFNTHKGFCDFSLQLTGVNVKKMVTANGKVLATDGNSLLLMNEQGERLMSSQLLLDNTFLLQDALYNDGSYFLLYQHTGAVADFTLIALDESLNPIWQKGFTHQGSTFGYAMSAKHNGGVVIAGRSCSTGFFLYAVDANGGETWKQLYLQGNSSVLPGALHTDQSGYTVAFGFEANDVYNLGLMRCDDAGQVMQTSVTALPTAFNIKGMAVGSNGVEVLLNRPSANTNSIVSFTNALQAADRYELSYPSDLQLTGIALYGNNVYVAGNLLQANTNNLDFVYARFDPITHAMDAFSAGTANAYDNASCIGFSNDRIWIGGFLSGNGEVLSLSNSNTALCSYQPVSLSLETAVCNSAVYNPTASMPSAFVATQTSVSAVEGQMSIAITCAVTATSVNETHGRSSDDAGSFNLYPNPATDFVAVDVSNDKLTRLSICTATEQCVYRQAVESGINRIDISQLPAAVYMITICDPQNAVRQTRRLIRLP